MRTEETSQTPSPEPPAIVISYPAILLIREITPNEKDPESFDITFAATLDKETIASIVYSSRAHGILAELKTMDARAKYEP